MRGKSAAYPVLRIHWANRAAERVRSGEAVVGSLGLGYGGLPWAMVFARKFRVIGFDVSS